MPVAPPFSNLVPPPIFDLDKILFAQALASTLHFSLDELSGMVYEHILRCFIVEDPSSRYSKLFQAIVIVVCGDILKLVALMQKASKLLVMVNDISGLHPIVIGEMFFQLINHSIVL
jgi:hypothetical protein